MTHIPHWRKHTTRIYTHKLMLIHSKFFEIVWQYLGVIQSLHSNGWQMHRCEANHISIFAFEFLKTILSYFLIWLPAKHQMFAIVGAIQCRKYRKQTLSINCHVLILFTGCACTTKVALMSSMQPVLFIQVEELR